MIDAENKSCSNCFFDDCEIDEYPCTHCRNNVVPSDPKFERTPLLWASRECSNVSPTNSVNHPSHYNQGGIECIDAMIAAYGTEAVKHFCMCNAFKYVWRADHKNGEEDIEKAIWYLNKYKELTDND